MLAIVLTLIYVKDRREEGCKDTFFLKRTLSVLMFLKDLQAGHFQINKSDDFDEVQDISVMSVGGVVQGQVMVSLRMY